jgi:hypothetical protein
MSPVPEPHDKPKLGCADLQRWTSVLTWPAITGRDRGRKALRTNVRKTWLDAIQATSAPCRCSRMDASASPSATAETEARMPRWNVWFGGGVMFVFALACFGMAARLWRHSPRTSNHLLAAATFALPLLAVWYLDRVCPRRVSASAAGLDWVSFVFGRRHHAPWAAIASAQIVFTKTNDRHGDVRLKFHGRIGRLVLPGQMIDREGVLAVLRTNRADLV